MKFHGTFMSFFGTQQHPILGYGNVQLEQSTMIVIFWHGGFNVLPA